METKELKVTIPEGCEIDWQESAKQEKIVFKKKDSKPRSWEEYCKLQKDDLKCGYIIDNMTHINAVEWKFSKIQDPSIWRNVLPSEELAEVFLAMMQLMSLRQEWIGDWKPDWSNDDISKWCIVYQTSDFYIFENSVTSRPLSFPTREMAIDFMECFKYLLEVAKPLL